MKNLLLITCLLLITFSLHAAVIDPNLPDATKLLGDDKIPVYHNTSGSRNISGATLKSEVLSDSMLSGNTSVQKLAVDGSGGVTSTQTGMSTVLPVLTLQGADTGAAPFQLQLQTFPNPGDSGATTNTGVWMGFNAAWHTGGHTAVNGKQSIFMGFEDNYLDAVGDKEYAKEWYIEGWSPDGTTVQMSRPYYTRGAQKDDGTDWWATVANIGSAGPLRQFTVREGLNNLLSIFPIQAYFHVPLEVKGNLDIHGGDLLLDNGRYIRVKNSAGSYSSVFHVSTNNNLYLGDVFNDLGGNVYLRSGGKDGVTLDPASATIHLPTKILGTLDVTGGALVLDKGQDMKVRKTDGTYASIFSMGTNDNLYFGDILGRTVGNVIMRSAGKDVLTLAPASATIHVPTKVLGSFEVQGGRLVMDNGQYLQMKNAAGAATSVLHLTTNNNLYIGDIFNSAGGKVFLRSGGKSAMTLSSAGNVGVGTESPTSKLQVVGLPVFNNNAAAIAGGLTSGAFYRTGADPDVVCVVH